MIAISLQPEQYSTRLLDYKTSFPITGVKTPVLTQNSLWKSLDKKS